MGLWMFSGAFGVLQPLSNPALPPAMPSLTMPTARCGTATGTSASSSLARVELARQVGLLLSAPRAARGCSEGGHGPSTHGPSLTEASKLVMSYVAAVCSKGEEVDKVKEQLLQSNPVLEGKSPHLAPQMHPSYPAFIPRAWHGHPGPCHNLVLLPQPLEMPRPSATTTPPDS